MLLAFSVHFAGTAGVPAIETSTEKSSPATSSCRLACVITGIATSSASARSIRLRTPSNSHTAALASPPVCLASCSRNPAISFAAAASEVAAASRSCSSADLAAEPNSCSAAFSAGAIVACTSGNRAANESAALPEVARRISPCHPSDFPPPEIPAAGKTHCRRTPACPAIDASRAPPSPSRRTSFPTMATLVRRQFHGVGGVAVARYARFQSHFPRRQPFRDLLRKHFRISRRPHRLRRQDSALLMMPVPGMCSAPPVDHHVRPVRAYHAHHIFQRQISPHFLACSGLFKYPVSSARVKYCCTP